MKSTEFVTEGFSKAIIGVFDELSQMFNKDIDTVVEMGILCRTNNVKLTMIETLLHITKECQPYLHQVGLENAFKLFRGVGDTYGDDINKRVRLDARTPRSMDADLFNAINAYFKEIYGGEFRNSMLSTGDQYHTRLFGRTYAVFPKGDFKFLWSPRVKDFNFAAGDFGKQLRQNGRIEGSSFSSDNRDTVNELFLEEFVKEIDWHSIDLNSAIASEAEIMVRCKSYRGLNWDMFEDYESTLIELLRMAQ